MTCAINTNHAGVARTPSTDRTFAKNASNASEAHSAQSSILAAVQALLGDVMTKDAGAPPPPSSGSMAGMESLTACVTQSELSALPQMTYGTSLDPVIRSLERYDASNRTRSSNSTTTDGHRRHHVTFDDMFSDVNRPSAGDAHERVPSAEAVVATAPNWSAATLSERLRIARPAATDVEWASRTPSEVCVQAQPTTSPSDPRSLCAPDRSGLMGAYDALASCYAEAPQAIRVVTADAWSEVDSALFQADISASSIIGFDTETAPSGFFPNIARRVRGPHLIQIATPRRVWVYQTTAAAVTRDDAPATPPLASACGAFRRSTICQNTARTTHTSPSSSRGSDLPGWVSSSPSSSSSSSSSVYLPALPLVMERLLSGHGGGVPHSAAANGGVLSAYGRPLIVGFGCGKDLAELFDAGLLRRNWPAGRGTPSEGAPVIDIGRLFVTHGGGRAGDVVALPDGRDGEFYWPDMTTTTTTTRDGAAAAESSGTRPHQPEWQRRSWLTARVGIQQAVARVFRRFYDKPKSVQISNWAARPLSPRQVSYAAKDAFVPMLIFAELLRRRGGGSRCR